MTNQETNEKVAHGLGWHRTSGTHNGWFRESHHLEVPTLPDYATSIEAAWEIIQHVRGYFALIRKENGQWVCWFDDSSVSCAETAPRAICEAYLKLHQLQGEGDYRGRGLSSPTSPL